MTRLLLKYDIQLPYGREEKPYTYNQIDLITLETERREVSVIEELRTRDGDEDVSVLSNAQPPQKL